MFTYKLNFNKSNRYANESADVDFSQTHPTAELTLAQVKIVIDAINANVLVFEGEENENPLVVHKEEITGVITSNAEGKAEDSALKVSLAEANNKVEVLLDELDDAKRKIKEYEDKIVALDGEIVQLVNKNEASSAQVVDLNEKLIAAKGKTKKAGE